MTTDAMTTPRLVTDAVFDRALAAWQHDLGAANVRTGDELSAWTDPYAFDAAMTHVPRAVVLPGSVAEVQAVLRTATAFGIPLWTVSMGRNYGYGGAGARVPDSVVVDLHRMDQVLSVDEETCVAMVEPGVTFLALHQHLLDHAPGVWSSVPDIGWGSVIGNALERGFGYTPHGEHAAFVCGLEVVLADGRVIRTGMGAKGGSTAWPLYRGGHGPSIDGLFLQSNLGIVTKMGVWLMPRPEQAVVVMAKTARESDLGVLVDTLRPLLLDGTIQSNAVIGNAPVIASVRTPRAAWWTGEGPLPADAVHAIMDRTGLGWWNARFGLYGPAAITQARLSAVRAALDRVPGCELEVRTYAGDVPAAEVHPADHAQLGVPGTDAVRMAAWRGGDPAHTDFSLVCAPTGQEATAQMTMIKERIESRGFDYAGGFTLFPRHAIALALVSFDRSDAHECHGVGELFPELVRAASERGWAPYRSHLAFMDLIADQYDFNDQALRGVVESLKDTLDPAGVLSPGKQGIWPGRSGRE